MELFSLLAKLTLDTKEYDKAISEAESTAKGMSIEDPKLGLNKDEFDSGISDAENTDVDLKDAELGLDSTEFDTNLQNSQDKAGTFSDTVGSIFNNLSGVLATAGIAGIVGGIVTQLKEGVDLARTHGDMIDKQSQKMNISAKAYQEWSYALDLSGASIDDLNRGLRTWQQSVGDEEAIGKMSDAFNALGIDAETAFKKIENGENLDQLLDQVMYGLADYSGGDRGAIVETLFGRNANGLNALLNQTSEDIRNAKEEAEDLGMIMSDQEVKNAANYNDAVTRLEGALNGIREAFAANIIPLLTDAANTVARIIAFFNPRAGETSLSDMFKTTDKEFAKNLTTIEGTSGAAVDLIDKLFAMGNAEKLTAEQQAEWKATADWLIENIPSLSGVIDTDTLSINGNKDAIVENIKEWEKLSKQRAVAQAKEAKQQAMNEKNADALDKVAQARAKGFEIEQKQNEQISEANRLLRDNATLSEMFSAAYGTTTIDKNADNFQAMMDWMNDVGYEFADTRSLQDITQELIGLNNEQRTLNTEAKTAQEQLDAATQEYLLWEKAIDELYGTEEESAKGANASAKDLKKTIDSLPGRKVIELVAPRMMQYAIGSDYIPYDQMAILHRGERVITATEARQERSAGGDFSGLEDRIEAAIRRGMDGVSVRSYLNGKDITDEVNRNNINAVKGRRFSG